MKHFIVSIVFAGGLLVFATHPCKAGDIYLVKGNQAATITISPSAGDVERYAAQELQRSLQLMTGVTLKIATTDKEVQGVRIMIGTPATHQRISRMAALLALAGAGEEQIAVRRHENTLYLAGNTPRAALYATYTFLEEVLGARWYWPGRSGEYLPKHAVVRLGTLNISESPSLKIRSLAITGVPNGDPDTDTWMARNRLNVVSSRAGYDTTGITTKQRRAKGFLIRVAGHNVVLPEEVLKQHPEYLAEIGGKRQFHPRGASHLCWSNPALQDEVVRMIGSWWGQPPFPDVVHFYPADQTQYCQCNNCKAMGDISTRWQKFSALLIKKLNRVHPGKKYWTYAYLEYKTVPDTEPAPFEFIGYALYDASYPHLLSTGNPFNELAVTEVDGWLKKGVNLGVRGYEYIVFKPPMFVPMVSWVVDQFQWMKAKKMTGYLSELPPYGSPDNVPVENTYWTCNRMALYAATKAMWNTNVSAVAIVKDWCATVYGPGSAAMDDYYWAMEKAWKDNPQRIAVFLNSPAGLVDQFLSPAKFEQLHRYFAQGFRNIATIKDTAIQKRIESEMVLEKKMLDNWQTIFQLKHLRANRYRASIAPATVGTGQQMVLPTKLPLPEDAKGRVLDSAPEVTVGWTKDSLLLQIHYNNNNATAYKAGTYLRNDQAGNGDLPGIWIQPNPNKPELLKLNIHPQGTITDSKVYGGIYEDVRWNASWTVHAIVRQTTSTLLISVPFTSLGIQPRDNTKWRMAIKHPAMATSPYSGWPDATPPDALNLATITLVDQQPERSSKRIALYDAGADSSPLSVELQNAGWDVAIGTSDTTLQQLITEQVLALLIRYPGNKTFSLSPAFMKSVLQHYVEQGGLLILVANSEIPVHQWFPDTPPVTWAGFKHAPVRKSAYSLPGLWQTTPNDLAEILVKGVTPPAGYLPQSAGWDVLATIHQQQETATTPWLLTKRIGKGLLVLTSAPMGYSGGFEMLGNRNTQNVVKLIENLQHFK